MANKHKDVMGKLDKDKQDLYLYWLENHSRRHMIKWIGEYGIGTCMSVEYIDYMTNKFVQWAKRS